MDFLVVEKVLYPSVSSLMASYCLVSFERFPRFSCLKALLWEAARFHKAICLAFLKQFASC